MVGSVFRITAREIIVSEKVSLCEAKKRKQEHAATYVNDMPSADGLPISSNRLSILDLSYLVSERKFGSN